MEGISANVRLPYPTQHVRAWSLDASGERNTALPVVADGESSVLYLGPAYHTLWYEVQVVP